MVIRRVINRQFIDKKDTSTVRILLVANIKSSIDYHALVFESGGQREKKKRTSLSRAFVTVILLKNNVRKN